MRLTYQPRHFIILKAIALVYETGAIAITINPTSWEAITMISTQQLEAKTVHPLARFITKEAIALRLNLKTEEIYRISCWRYVIHIVGKGISTFVSYADLPPVTEVEPPSNRDFVCWRKRWKQKNKKQAPEFWSEFFRAKFAQACSATELYQWGQVVHLNQVGTRLNSSAKTAECLSRSQILARTYS